MIRHASKSYKNIEIWKRDTGFLLSLQPKSIRMLIGRDKEIQELQQAYNSDESKFVAIFGRRRIGKTYLVREVFQDRFAFTYSGMANASTKEQLQRFYLSLKDYGYKSAVKPNNWIEAFYMLEQYLKELPEGKKVVFLEGLFMFV